MNIQFQRYKGLWVTGILLGIVGVVLAYLTFRSRSTFTDARGRLQNAQASIERLQRAQPHPSRENVAIAEENVAQKQAFRDSLLQSMSRNQFEPLNVEPAAFPLGPTLVRLRAAARQSGVALKADEAFGFQRYVAAGVPSTATNEIGRLTVQLQTIEHVCRVLFANGISELVSVSRTTFEAPEPGDDGGGRRRRGAAQFDEFAVQQFDVPVDTEEPPLFQPERVTVSFRSEPAALLRVLNAFAADRSFVVVADLRVETAEMKKESPAARPATPGAATRAPGATDDGPPPAPLPHRERILAGEEEVTVTLTLDVYRFELPGAEDGPADMTGDSIDG